MTTIADILRDKGSDVVAADPDTPLQKIAETIASRRIGAVVVLEPGRKLAGIVSERDIVKAIATHPQRIDGIVVREIMTRDVTTAGPQTTMEEAIEIMDRGYFRHLPVVENGELLGIISIRDLVKTRVQLNEFETDNLRSYIHGRF